MNSPFLKKVGVGSDKNIIAIIKVIMEYIVLVVHVIYTGREKACE